MKVEAAVIVCAIASVIGGAAITGVLPGMGDESWDAPPYPEIADDRWAMTDWFREDHDWTRPLVFSDDFVVNISRDRVEAGEQVEVNVTNRSNRTLQMSGSRRCGLWVAQPGTNWTVFADLPGPFTQQVWSWEPGTNCTDDLETGRVRDGPSREQDPSPLSPGWYRVVFTWETEGNRTALAWDDVLVQPS